MCSLKLLGHYWNSLYVSISSINALERDTDQIIGAFIPCWQNKITQAWLWAITNNIDVIIHLGIWITDSQRKYMYNKSVRYRLFVWMSVWLCLVLCLYSLLLAPPHSHTISFSFIFFNTNQSCQYIVPAYMFMDVSALKKKVSVHTHKQWNTQKYGLWAAVPRL